MDALSSFDEKPRNFMKHCYTNFYHKLRKNVGPSVEQIIAYTNPLRILFGLGSNGGGAVMSTDLGNTWISVNSFVYQKTLNTSTEIITASVIPWISLSGSIDNTLFESFCKMRVAQQWNGK
ncbi:hypothetical protein Smp_137250 [Schistosoma mansoni]|uniref:hypothetical protein n=1 Tax=Schistosoma mansoni TaxID=6183 RepID=UPI00022C845B|nr:hypothetical protein Smp_137250 [Schistosoma mansoni]|eukprot:XP_018644174.1 hypothetical protein Smp_137250 [Schistosoma mansoni]